MNAIQLLYAGNVIFHEAAPLRQRLDFRVLVEHGDLEKQVEVHWAGDDGVWRTLPASFVVAVSPTAEVWHARAEFTANAGHLPGNVTFALRCATRRGEAWDNHGGQNHAVAADSGLRLASGVGVLHTDPVVRLQGAQPFLPVTIATQTREAVQAVFVRWTVDRWRTCRDEPCFFWRRHWHGAAGSAAHNPNRYGTHLWVTHLPIAEAFRVEYAIGCATDCGLVWDNNFGRNYLARRAPLRVLTLNLHCNQEENQDAKLSTIAQAIRELEIDVVCLQEVAEPWNEGQGDPVANTANILRQRAGPTWHLFYDWSHIGFGQYRESCAILSRFPLLRTGSTYLSSSREPTNIHTRKAVMAQVRVPYLGAINVLSVHLSWWEAGYREQFMRLREWAGALHTDDLAATIIGGDFNANTQSEAYALTTQGGEFVDQLPLATPQAVYGVDGPGGWSAPPRADPQRIDFIYLRRGARLVAVGGRELFNGAAYGRVSDHTGYLIEFEPR